jgi:hypothetical protein
MERRLEFIEFRLFWDGHVNRSDLIRVFGISAQQASADINRYGALAPQNLIYDKSAKSYVRGAKFSALFAELDAARYLAQVHSVASGIVDPVQSWIHNLPSFDAAPAPARGIKPKVLRAVIAAIRRTEAIQVRYQSLSRPDPIWRWIAPHAIGFDGFRWHARAFCDIDKTFKDFLLSRMIDVRAGRPATSSSCSDSDWNEVLVLKIAPHPDLSDGQKKVIAQDYGMKSGIAEIKVRRAFLYYTLRRLGLDTDPTARRPQDQQIVLINPNAPEIAAVLGLGAH